MIVRAPVHLLGASAITVWPLILVSPRVVGEVQLANLLHHERVHVEQQRRWALYGLGVGLLLWWALYLLALPVGINPWRQRWETEAYRAGGYPDPVIRSALRRSPYWLWWQP